MKNNKGFTLIELIVVIAIMAIVGTVIVPAFTGYIQGAQDSSDDANARAIFTASYQAIRRNESSGNVYVSTEFKESLMRDFEISDIDFRSQDGILVAVWYDKNGDQCYYPSKEVFENGEANVPEIVLPPVVVQPEVTPEPEVNPEPEEEVVPTPQPEVVVPAPEEEKGEYDDCSTWVKGTEYKKGDIVIYEGYVYEAKQDVNKWQTGNPKAENWNWDVIAKIDDNTGDYNYDEFIQGKAYVAGDKVVFNGQVYVCKWWTTGSPSANPDAWNVW